MSERQTTLILKPPERLRTEGFVSPGHVCGYCGGRGWFAGSERDGAAVTCPDCGGTGEVTAVVAVEWKPGNKKETDG